MVLEVFFSVDVSRLNSALRRTRQQLKTGPDGFDSAVPESGPSALPWVAKHVGAMEL